jgi:hypothetical protein
LGVVKQGKKVLVLISIGLISYLVVGQILVFLKQGGYYRLFRATMPYDLVIKHGMILDGSGERDGYRGDVAIREGIIVRVGYVEEKESPTFDAGGLTLIPRPVEVFPDRGAVEHLLKTSYPRYSAEQIFFQHQPYQGLSLAQAAYGEGVKPDVLLARLVAEGRGEEKVLLLPLPEIDHASSISVLAALTGHRSLVQELETGMIREGYRADLCIFPTRAYKEEELRKIFRQGRVPDPVFIVKDGEFIKQ